ncbi:hypothetical protein [Novosphingobium sp. P6W]|uniref:hypothetical protein n=1 Tax=Novosphingobium sp. P6W TaxID=1609758 RepID=UPI0005C2C2D1|nr:hypothetical protein [Novosphingobium sp. P6W]AXB80419.1 hypothetical protein TQ38_028065 [Novosphingobium sp. P6W]KIS31307.1 hypothetical protein TQ38_17565 [Novosphingobium sp. P6W]
MIGRSPNELASTAQHGCDCTIKILDGISYRCKAGVEIERGRFVTGATVNHLPQICSDGRCASRYCSKVEVRRHRESIGQTLRNDHVRTVAILFERVDQPKERHSATGKAGRIGFQKVARSREVDGSEPSGAIVA